MVTKRNNMQYLTTGWNTKLEIMDMGNNMQNVRTVQGLW